ncbi:MAG: ribosome-associated translation inhibitor RaiA [Brockia lithotrophica]|nr:ribosome-associated translation inhibitor RaiA [Brockia lithotrophica]
MRTVVRGENVEVTPAIRDYAEKRLKKIEKYFHNIDEVTAYVNLKVYRDGQRAEVTIPLNSLILRAEDKTHDVYAALDNVVDKLVRQIHKYKTRINRKAREQGAIFVEAVSEAGTEGEEKEEEVAIARRKQVPLKPMTAEEAILQMNLLGHDFYVYRDAATEEVHVVYRRKDGTYGLIEPTAATE